MIARSAVETPPFFTIASTLYPGSGNLSSDPAFANVPLEATYATSAGTTTTVVLAEVEAIIFGGYAIEIDDDGVARTVTGILGDTITFTPACGSSTKVGTHVDIWGADAANLAVDFHLGEGSPCIDAANGSTAPTLDLEGSARYDDPDVANTGIGPPWADMGAYEYQP